MIKFELEEFHRNIPDSELLEDLQRVATAMNQDSLTLRSYNKANGGKFSGSTINLRFGGWNTALNRAGIEITMHINIPVEDLFLNMESIWRHLGRQPRFREMRTPLSKFSSTTYAERFGSYRKSLEAFIQYINQAENDDIGFEEEPISTEPSQVQKSQKSSRHINWRTRFLVMRRDDFKCQYCGRSPSNNPGLELHIDHVLAFSKDGLTTMDNLKTACNVCDIGKSNLAATETD